jgi:hypothetical protein
MQHARFKPHAEERTLHVRGSAHATPSRDLTLGVMQASLELEYPHPGVLRTAWGKRTRELVSTNGC